MSARDELTPEQRATLAEQLGDAKPARAGLLMSFGKSVRDRREHDHTTQREDWYCLNLAAYMGERAAPVLRRLLDAESRAERYRTAWQRARTRARSLAGAADRYAERARVGQEALQNTFFTILALEMERAEQRKTTLREAATSLRKLHREMPAAGREQYGEGVLRAALALDEQAEQPTPATVELAPLGTALRARIYDLLTGAAKTDAFPALKLAQVRQYLAEIITEGLLEPSDGETEVRR